MIVTLIFRILFGIIMILFVSSQIILPVFDKSISYFWIFKNRKLTKEMNSLREKKMHKKITDEIKEYKQTL